MSTSDKSKFVQKVFNFFDRPPSPFLECKDASLTRQEFLDESDINNIMAKYAQGLAPVPSGDRPPLYGDFSSVPDYQHALQIVIDAQERFDSLPAQVRERFGNDPGRLLDFLCHEENYEEGVKLGFFEKKEVESEVKSNPESEVK